MATSEGKDLQGEKARAPQRALEAVRARDRQVPPLREDEAQPSRVQALRLL